MSYLALKSCGSRLPPLLLFVLPMVLLMAGCGNGRTAPSVAHNSTPEGAVKGFLTWRINSRITGTPDATQLEAMSPYISGELRALLETARAEYDAGAGRSTERKRMLGESDLFSSMFDGPTSFAMGETETRGTEHFIPVRFMSARQLPAVHWVDRVRVVREHDHYVVADVEYANHWSLGNRSTLLSALKGATAKREPRPT